MPVISALGRMRQEDCSEFQARLGYSEYQDILGRASKQKKRRIAKKTV